MDFWTFAEAGALDKLLLVLLLGTARLFGAFLILPVFSGTVFSGFTRIVVLLGISAEMLPMLLPLVPSEIGADPLRLGILVLKELGLGLLIGFVAAVPFWAAESAGIFIDTQKGTTLGGILSPGMEWTGSPTGDLLFQVVSVLFFTGGGFLFFLGSILTSYLLWPLSSFFPQLGSQFPVFFLQLADQLMRLILSWGAPVVLILFVTELGLGLLNRFVPQLNEFLLALPVKAALASLILLVYVGFFMSYVQQRFDGFRDLNRFLEGVFRR
ncbi:MAG: type III secretion system export apparatus subunit SctT [Methylacidiphilaceae bacterium]|nr:type III secretion system export apparatus subunit SctT [Candidatus Methylacidiphilaceae bacterium]